MARILIADDHESLRTALRKALMARDGWTVCGEAADGASAVNMAEQLKPDLIILDFLMPLKNGIAAAVEILKVLPNVPIVLYTMHKSAQLQAEARRAGIRQVVSKVEPFDAFVANLGEFIGDAARPIGPLGLSAGCEVESEIKSVANAEEVATQIAADPTSKEPDEPSLC